MAKKTSKSKPKMSDGVIVTRNQYGDLDVFVCEDDLKNFMTDGEKMEVGYYELKNVRKVKAIQTTTLEDVK